MNNSCDILDHDHFFIFGAARSGLAAAKLLQSHNKIVAVYDEAPPDKLIQAREELRALGVPLLENLDRDIFPFFHQRLDDATETMPSTWEVMILSPGISTNHPLVGAALERGCLVRSEIELAWQSSSIPMIGITGTNGKTTTTHLVSHLLMTAGHAAPVAGNVGRPLSDVVLDPILKAPGSVVVCEVSSYQLETIERFRPRVACVTNIAPDHLERYGTMDRYIEAKRWITVNQNEDDILVLNAEDAYCRSFVAHTRARVRHFSSKRPVAHGAFLENGALYFSFDNQDPPARIMSRDEIPLPGNHNVENVLAAIVVCQAMGLSLEVMADGVRSFQAVPHRIEKCGVVDGVEYYNDSKATNLDSMSKALESFDRPIVLIAGGRDKGSPWTVLNELVKRKVKALVLIGEAAPIGRKAWGALVREVEDAGGMEDAVRRARALAKAGDVVLLSPGCASFDMYKNFEERGDDFKRVVRDMAGVS